MNQEAYEKMKKREAEAAKKWQDEQNDKWIAKWSALRNRLSLLLLTSPTWKVFGRDDEYKRSS